MKKIITAVLISLLLFIGTAPAQPSNYFITPACHDDVSTLPIFRLDTKQQNGKRIKNGTTFLIDEDLWATAYHAVVHDGMENLKHEIVLPNGDTIIAGVIATDPTADIAILYAPSGNMTPLNKLSERLEAFEPVWNVGLPGLSDNKIVSFEGIVMNVEDIFLVSNTIAFTGMSGGPQFRCNGDRLEVVGVIVKSAMSLFQTMEMEREDGTIGNDFYYQIEGSRSSPHIGGLLIEIVITR